MLDDSGGRRRFLHTLAAAGVSSVAALPDRAFGQPRRRLRFGVGPFLPTPDDSRRAFAPLFAHLAKHLGASDHTLDVTTDWAGLAVAMATGNLDILSDAMVREVLMDDAGKATGVAFIDRRKGHELKAKARVVVLSASACESVLFEFQLTATDCTGATSTDIVSYTVSCCGVTAP
jgi:ABC-type phosphate/phosphonate transport system substrate-binding protein